MVLCLLGVFVFWLQVKINFKGLACGVVRLGPGTALLQRVVVPCGRPLCRPIFTNTIRSIATFRAPDGFACKARWRRHSCSTSSHLNAAGGFVRRPRRACISARVDCDCYDKRVARCRLSYRLRADALPHAPRDKLNEAIFLIVLVIDRAAERPATVVGRLVVWSFRKDETTRRRNDNPSTGGDVAEGEVFFRSVRRQGTFFEILDVTRHYAGTLSRFCG